MTKKQNIDLDEKTTGNDNDINVKNESIINIEENKISNNEFDKQTLNYQEVANDKFQTKQKKSKINRAEIVQFFKFLAFSLSAGVIQLLSFELLYNWTNALPWWPSYLISIILSVIWNFTFNRKFTFKSASNVPISMTLALCFYVMFIPVSVFGGDALEASGWNGTLVTLLMMVINFILEYFWDKFLVFNDKIVASILKKFKIKRTCPIDEEKLNETKIEGNQENEVVKKNNIVENREEK